MNKKKWVAYGLTGAIGLAVIAGGAAAVASTMDLRTSGGETVPGGAINGREGVLDRDQVNLRVTDSSVTVVSALSPTVVSAPSARSAPSPVSVASAPTPPPAPAPALAPAPPAPLVYDSPASAPSPMSAPSPVSAPSAASPASVASAWSD